MNQIIQTILVLCLAVSTTGVLKAETGESSFSGLVMEGYRLENEGNYAQAVQEYSKALELKDESVTVLIRRARAYVHLGKFHEAGEDLKTATFATPVSMSDYTSLAWLKATCPFDIIRDGVVAVAYARKALKERRSAETYDILAAAYAEMNDYQRARDMLLEGLKRFPDSTRTADMKLRLKLYKDKKPFREKWVDGELADEADKNVDKSF